MRMNVISWFYLSLMIIGGLGAVLFCLCRYLSIAQDKVTAGNKERYKTLWLFISCLLVICSVLLLLLGLDCIDVVGNKSYLQSNTFSKMNVVSFTDEMRDKYKDPFPREFLDVIYKQQRNELHNPYNDYDFIVSSVNMKNISFVEFGGYFLWPRLTKIFDINSQYVIATRRMALDGVLKASIQNGKIQYSLNGYHFYSNQQNNGDVLKSLSNNQRVHIELLYDVQEYYNDARFVKYKIVNAETM